MKSIISFSGLFILALALFAVPSFAADVDDRLNKLEDSLKNQQQTIEQQQVTIDTLKTQANKKGDQSPQAAAPVTLSQKASGLFGGSAFTNPNLSVVLDTFGYSSNLTNNELANRGIPGFTTQGLDQRHGFNLDSVELFLFSPVDPYLPTSILTSR